ncbi:MAG: type IV toxin-antitoxin system AbiEi family antitoxin [Vicinamibacterales bacterium]
MGRTTSIKESVFLEPIRQLPFVREAALAAAGSGGRADAVLTVTAGRERFTLAAIQRLSYLDRTVLHALKAIAVASQRPLILFARYVPRATGETLIDAGINFVDRAGNLHLRLGGRYERTILGRPEAHPTKAEGRLTPAHVQWLFALAADPEVRSQPVRQVAEQAGLGKSQVANLRKQWAGQTTKARFRDIEAQLVAGYSQVLRPKILLGRFRASESDTAALAERFQKACAASGTRFALTGGAGAERLQRYYNSPDFQVFVESWTPEIERQLRLIPDREGPITVLRAFGSLAFWKELDSIFVAHPWLLFTELMHSEDPRAHEAAEELRREYLVS